jgi:hypothetical protein
MREQEVDLRWIEFCQRLVRPPRVVAKVDGAQQPAEKVPERRPRQPLQTGRDGGVTTPPAAKPAMPVVRLRAAVKAHTHPDAKLVEQPQVRIVKADAIRLHPNVYLHTGANGGARGAHEFGYKITSGKQRLSAMQDNGHAQYLVAADVLADACRSTLGGLARHPARTVPPGLISHLVHIAVVTRQIASAVNLDDELAEGNWTPTADHKPRYIKGMRPFDSRRSYHGPIKPYTVIKSQGAKGDQ